MEFTVCVCVRDGAEHVDRWMRAMVSETAADAIPIVVVDHGSRDRTPALLERWMGEIPDRLRVLRFDGEGIAAARNLAWQSTGTPWVAFVDIDCEVQRGWADAVRDGLRRHAGDARCAAFGGSNRVRSDPRPLYRAYAVLLSTYVGGHNSILNRTVGEHRRVDHCPTLNTVYRRSALAEIDGFDPAFTLLAEDVDVSRRLVRRGYELWVNPDMTVEHALRPTLGKWLRNMFLYGRGRAFHLKRNPDAFQAKFLAPAAVVLAYAAAMAWTCVPGGTSSALAILTLLHVASIGALLLKATRRQGGGVVLWGAAITVVWLMHLTYGGGLLYELPRRMDKFVV